MRKSSKKKNSGRFQTLFTVLVTLLVVAIVIVFIYAWHILGFSSYSVSYSSSYSDIAGIFPEKRNFNSGDEVVVRAGSITRQGSEFIGWRDVHGVIESTGGILENGTVFIMPKNDVLLEAVWDDDLENEQDSENSDDLTDETASSETSEAVIYYKKSGKDYINVRSSYNYNSEVVTKISDSDMKIEYYGKSENLYDEDDRTTYTWLFVKIPELEKEGWIRSDMLSKEPDSEKAETTKSDIYLKSANHDSIKMYKEADSASDVLENIEDDEITLLFKGETKNTTESDGNTVTWYLIENSSSGKTGWIEKDKLQQFEE